VSVSVSDLSGECTEPCGRTRRSRVVELQAPIRQPRASSTVTQTVLMHSSADRTIVLVADRKRLSVRCEAFLAISPRHDTQPEVRQREGVRDALEHQQLRRRETDLVPFT
jgi:hypothetical protein